MTCQRMLNGVRTGAAFRDCGSDLAQLAPYLSQYLENVCAGPTRTCFTEQACLAKES